MTEDLLIEFAKALINALAFSLVAGIVAISTSLFVVWLDVRSLKKSSRSAFIKIRDLEEKVYGKVTSELDGR